MLIIGWKKEENTLWFYQDVWEPPYQVNLKFSENTSALNIFFQ